MGIRINKYLSAAGYCSRRQADRLTEEGRVTIDGKTADCGSRVLDGQEVCVDGRVIRNNSDTLLFAVNKPAGIVCTTTDNQGENNIVSFLNYPVRIYPVGRLDKDSTGLLLMTNNGEIMDKILRSVNGHEKEYIVEVDAPVDDEFIKKMSEPVYIKELDRWTKPCKVYREGKKCFRIILTQGLNRQIRRMSEINGRKVVKLERIRIMNIHLGDLGPGEMRRITDEEYKKLLKMLG